MRALMITMLLLSACIFDTPLSQDQADRARKLCEHFSSFGQSEETRARRLDACGEIKAGDTPPPAMVVPPMVPDVPQLMVGGGLLDRWRRPAATPPTPASAPAPAPVTPMRPTWPLECRTQRNAQTWERVHGDLQRGPLWDDPQFTTQNGLQKDMDGRPIFDVRTCTSCQSTIYRPCE